MGFAVYIFLGVLLVAFFVSAINILREYERGVVFTLGRFTRVTGPGFIIIIPVIQQMVRVDLRTFVEDVPTQDVISRDNVSVKVNAVLYFRIGHVCKQLDGGRTGDHEDNVITVVLRAAYEEWRGDSILQVGTRQSHKIAWRHFQVASRLPFPSPLPRVRAVARRHNL